MLLTFKANWRVAAVVVAAAAVAGCEQYVARNFGGKIDFKLPCDEKLVTATWKEGNDLWYLTRPFRPGEKPEVSLFKVSTLYGMLEGQVAFYESACTQGEVPR